VDTTVQQFINSGVLQNLLQSISTMSGEFSRKKVTEGVNSVEAKIEKKPKVELSSESESVESLASPDPKAKKAIKTSKQSNHSDDSWDEDDDMIKKAIYDA
jgi:hypothetical protein